MIPRPVTGTTAKRRTEEAAREAERRSSARNNDNATIGAGGKLTLAGGIDVVDAGEVRVIGEGYDANTGQPYEVTSRLGTYENEGNYGIYQSPALIFSSSIFGNRARAIVWSRSGDEVWIQGETDLAATSVFVGDSFSAGFNSRDPALNGAHRTGSLAVSEDGLKASFSDDQAGTQAGLEVRRYNDPTATLHVGHFTWRDTLFARLRTKLGGKLWLESNSATGTSAIVMDGAGNIDLQTSGKLTGNGQPIGGGVSSIGGKTGAVTLADLGLNKVDNTADVDKPISTKTQTALDGKADKGALGAVAHAEFTATAALPASMPVITPIGANFTLDPDQSKNSGYATATTASRIKLTAGTYSILYYADCGASMGTGAVLSITNPVTGKRYISADVVPNAWNSPLPHPNLYLPADAEIQFEIAQKSGQARTCNIRVSIEKDK